MARRLQSATSINMYRRCPRKYYLRYIRRLKQRSSIYLIRGSAVHEAIAGFHQLKVRDSRYPESLKATLQSLFRDAWLSHADQLKQLKMGETTIDGYYQESLKMLSGWLNRYLKQGRRIFRKTRPEVKLFSKTYYIMGIIDAIEERDNAVMITDYKTSKKDDITPDIKIQMALYALLYLDCFGALPDIMAIDFLKTGIERRFKVTPRFAEYAREQVRNIHKKTASTCETDYPCTCGGWCQKEFIWENGGR